MAISQEKFKEMLKEKGLKVTNQRLLVLEVLEAHSDRHMTAEDVYELVKEDAMKEIYLIQMREMAKKVYSVGLNIDYFPTNFIVQDELIYYIDYECNNYMEEWNFENWGIKYWSKTQEFHDYVNQH